MSASLGGLLDKIRRCPSWKNLYALKNEFADAGLLIIVSENGNKVLCRIENGQPITDKVLDDFIFIQSKDETSGIPRHMTETIIGFVHKNASANRIIDDMPSYKRYYSLYGSAIRIGNERSSIEEQIINSISNVLID